MKITKRQLRRITNEAFSGYADERPNNPMERAYARHVEDFETWVQETGQLPAVTQGQDQDRVAILATYLVDQGLDENIELIGVLTSEYKMDRTAVDQQLTTARAEYEAGGLESEEDNYERGSFRESKMKITKRQLKKNNTMKITKRQLRRIIKEEKTKLIHETMTDMTKFSDAIENSASNLSNMFADDMETLFLEDPEMFQGRSTKDEWLDQISLASDQLYELLSQEIRIAIESIETNLHDGQYHQPKTRNRPR